MPLPLPAAASPYFGPVIRQARAGTAISTWQKGQPLGDQLHSAIALGGLGLPLLLDWLQGETDAQDSGLAAAYEGALRTRFTDFRSDLGDPHIFCLGINSGFTSCAFRATVRAAQIQVCTEWPRWHFVDLDSVTQHDGLHYNSTGLDQVGALTWAAMDAVI